MTDNKRSFLVEENPIMTKEQRLELDDHKCVICKAPTNFVHHISYANVPKKEHKLWGKL